MGRSAKRGATRPAADASDTPMGMLARVTPCARSLSLSMTRGVFEKRNQGAAEDSKNAENDVVFAARHQYTWVEPSLTVDVELQVKLPAPRPVDGPPAMEAVSISASFQLQYELAPEAKLTEAEIEAFAKINSTFNAWPYWREFVHNATTRMGLPALTLPLLLVDRAVQLAGYGKTS